MWLQLRSRMPEQEDAFVAEPQKRSVESGIVGVVVEVVEIAGVMNGCSSPHLQPFVHLLPLYWTPTAVSPSVHEVPSQRYSRSRCRYHRTHFEGRHQV